MKRERIDRLLTEKGLCRSREEARRFIMAGNVIANNMRINKASTLVPLDAEISVEEKVRRYVSRGGEKLKSAIDNFKVSFTGKIAMDVGCSTGGFTDCLLKEGIAHVYAIDVGYGQLDMSLRNHPRVTVMERRNIRYLDPAEIPDRIDLAVVDVSFISLNLVLPKIRELLKAGGICIALIKPQFELEPRRVGKGGIIRKEEYVFMAVDKVRSFAEARGFKVIAVAPSMLKGAKGNQEYFIHLEAK